MLNRRRSPLPIVSKKCNTLHNYNYLLSHTSYRYMKLFAILGYSATSHIESMCC